MYGPGLSLNWLNLPWHPYLLKALQVIPMSSKDGEPWTNCFELSMWGLQENMSIWIFFFFFCLLKEMVARSFTLNSFLLLSYYFQIIFIYFVIMSMFIGINSKEEFGGQSLISSTVWSSKCTIETEKPHSTEVKVFWVLGRTNFLFFFSLFIYLFPNYFKGFIQRI